MNISKKIVLSLIASTFMLSIFAQLPVASGNKTTYGNSKTGKYLNTRGF